MEENDSAYPYNPEIYNEQRGLTKLELISAMCLQGILSYPFRQNEPYENTFEKVSSAIKHAKELLKQLNVEHE